MEDASKTPNNEPQSDSLEDQTTVVEPQGGGQTSGSSSTDASTVVSGGAQPSAPKKRSLKERLLHQNIYLLLFLALAVITAAMGIAIYLHGKQGKTNTNGIASQSLSTDSLKQLANSDVTVGDPKQVLTVQSNAIFSGNVLVQKDIEIAGKLKVGSSLSLTGISVSGQSTFDDLQVSKDLSVSGNAAIQGQLTAKSLSISGDGSFTGTVTAGALVANSLTLNSNLTLTKHLVVGGATPSRSNGTALGGGGTSSISGSDTAGSITINTGSGPGAGCFINVTFNQKYNATPSVIVTPVGSGAAEVNFYVNRSSTGFSVCGTAAAPASSTFGFDYFVIE